MNKKKLQEFIFKLYGVKPEYPWVKYPTFAVFRHEDNKKWFAVIMTVEKKKLGINQEGVTDVVNLKCAVELISSMRNQKGIFPAYHMNKEHWLTVSLDGSVNEETLKFLLALSFELTDKK